MRTAAAALLVVTVALSVAQKQKVNPERPEWDDKNEEEKVNARGCANLTLVLDNWKYAIMTQVKDLLLHDHNTVLPDYGRIQPLSDAVRDLYKEFNGLKELLAKLTVNFALVETLVDKMQSGRKPTVSRRKLKPPGATGQPQGRRKSRVIIRKVLRPVTSRT